jgi:hypothetical protein
MNNKHVAEVGSALLEVLVDRSDGINTIYSNNGVGLCS